jgi:hypothetical protein
MGIHRKLTTTFSSCQKPSTRRLASTGRALSQSARSPKTGKQASPHNPPSGQSRPPAPSGTARASNIQPDHTCPHRIGPDTTPPPVYALLCNQDRDGLSPAAAQQPATSLAQARNVSLPHSTRQPTARMQIEPAAASTTRDRPGSKPSTSKRHVRTGVRQPCSLKNQASQQQAARTVERTHSPAPHGPLRHQQQVRISPARHGKPSVRRRFTLYSVTRTETACHQLQSDSEQPVGHGKTVPPHGPRPPAEPVRISPPPHHSTASHRTAAGLRFTL